MPVRSTLRHSHRRTKQRLATFAAWVVAHQPAAARNLFRRAELLNDIAKAAGSSRGRLYRVKMALLLRALALAPAHFRIRIDDDRHVGLPSIEFRPTGHRLHVPWDAVLSLDPSPMPAVRQRAACATREVRRGA